jgi:hypothetical protein
LLDLPLAAVTTTATTVVMTVIAAIIGIAAASGTDKQAGDREYCQ